MIFLSETKMRDNKIDGVRRRLGYANGFNVSLVGGVRGLSLWWDNSVEVKIIFSSKFIIDSVRRCKGELTWERLTGVYGTPYAAEKDNFWDWMATHFGPSDIPWLCGGDFNEFLWDYEKSGGAEVLYNRPRYFEYFLNAANLVDLGFNGPAFTWRGFRNGMWLRKDWIGLWQEKWPLTSVKHGTVLASDHCPIISKVEKDRPKGRRPFRFEAF